MVNYCSVCGCGRNSRTSKQLYYYGLPKERHRQVEWLKAAGREDLLDKTQDKLTHRFCSRHFEPSHIKNKHLCADATPTLLLPGVWEKDASEGSDDEIKHQSTVCNSCGNPILGFLYKCVTCNDYDLCPKCEMMETHSFHYMLRIPKPMKFKLADDLVNKWRQFFKAEHVTPDVKEKHEQRTGDSDSSDDEPITKYVKTYDSGIDLSEDVKIKIRNEVARVLKVKDTDKRNKKKALKKRNETITKKRNGNELERNGKKQKLDECDLETDDLAGGDAPEVVFADVNEIKDSQILDVKNELPISFVSNTEGTGPAPIMHVKLSDDLTELMIEVTKDDQKTIYKYK